MNRAGFENIKMFVGPEVEHTPAYSKRTLFVIGKQNVEQIEQMARENRTPHVFMGANHSFDSYPDDVEYWDQTITTLLDKGFWVTLDYPAYLHGNVRSMLSAGIWQSRMFVPLLSVRIPGIQTSSANLTVKIDDIDFAATNPGVWCIHHHELTDSNRFTDWQEYNNDEVLEPVTELAAPVVTKTPVAPVAELYAEVNTPGLNLEHVPVVEELKNDAALGLDTESKSQLKPDPNEEEEKVQAAISTGPANAAEAYASTETTEPVTATKAPAKKIKGKA